MLPRRGLTDNTGAEAGFERRLLARHCEPGGSGGGGRKVALALASPPLGANRPARMRGSVAAPRGSGSESQVQAQLQQRLLSPLSRPAEGGVTAGNGAGASAPARPAVGAAGELPARSAFSKPAAIRDKRCVNICPRRHLRRPSDRRNPVPDLPHSGVSRCCREASASAVSTAGVFLREPLPKRVTPWPLVNCTATIVAVTAHLRTLAAGQAPALCVLRTRVVPLNPHEKHVTWVP